MKKVSIICGVFAGLILLGFGMLAVLKQPAHKLEQTARAMVGRPEADLIKVLGQPMHVVSSDTLAGRTVDYPWKGMNFVPIPDHPVRNRVLLYSKLNMAIYVYVNEQGVVEYVATAWT